MKVALSVVSLTGEVTPADRAILDDDERMRADRFVFDRDRRRYVRAHVALRTILARATDRAPHELRFEVERDGKPRLRDERRISWNLSHSEDVAVIAVVDGGVEVGVDVEVAHPIPDHELDALAERYFTKPERDALLAADGDARLRDFFRCWTRKEACLKAVGAGLLLDTASFDCGVDVDEREVVVEWRGARRSLRVVSVDRTAPELAGVDVAIAIESGAGAPLAVDVLRFA